MNTLWFRYVRVMEIAERVHQLLRPRRMRRVPYSWPLAPEVCPCDTDFCEYLRQRAMRERRIFHFGTGGHHQVGLHNRRENCGHEIVAITASPAEHRAWQRLAARDPELGRGYRVMLADIYALDEHALPRFDLVTLFHLCEFTPPASAPHLLDDRGLLQSMVSRLESGGRLFFYSGSNGWRRTAALLDELTAAGILEPEEDFRSLRVYRRPRDERAT